jgi:bacterioferritin (cytochrome b1)
MQATTPGHNRTGAAVSPEGVNLMLQAVNELSPPTRISTLRMDIERQSHITEADRLGSIPAPTSVLKGAVKKGMAKVKGVSPNMFLDKLGERLAFERTAVRLYDALISKFLVLSESNGGASHLPSGLASLTPAADTSSSVATSEAPLDTLQRIRFDELSHFRMLADVIGRLGGDPTALTPCADVAAVASMGYAQAVTDPRTTVAQCLSAILSAELTDNAGWELLIQLATEAGQSSLADNFSRALRTEREHVTLIQGWLQVLLIHEVGTEAV